MELDHYQVLGVAPSASSADVKTAYRRALLLYHPDKALSRTTATLSDADAALETFYAGHSPSSLIPPSIDDIQLAYNTLSNPSLRATFDAQLAQSPHTHTSSKKGSQRPAEVISLEEFQANDAGDAYYYRCRCGDSYKITEEQLEEDVHLVGCQGCSETIWVGYEAVEVDD